MVQVLEMQEFLDDESAPYPGWLAEQLHVEREPSVRGALAQLVLHGPEAHALVVDYIDIAA